MLKKLIACLLATTALQGALAAQLPEVTVYKDPDCGCCTEWVKHMQESGFQVKQVNTRAMDVERQRFGVPPHLASCHTAKVGGYTVEGHVPASAVKKMLAEKPSVGGLTIPGMPANAPGMGPHIVGTLKVYTLPKAGESSRLYSVEQRRFPKVRMGEFWQCTHVNGRIRRHGCHVCWWWVTACASCGGLPVKTIADTIPPMRRWLTILLLVFLPFQFTWAAVAGYCQHETGAAAQHFGHHDHQHQAAADQDGTPDAKALGGGIDGDCVACHASCAAAIFSMASLPTSTSVSFAIPWLSGNLTAPPLAHPERPNWSVLA